MESSGTNPDAYRGSSSNTNSRRYAMFSASNIIQAPISTLLEYSGILRTRSSSHQETESLINGGIRDHLHNQGRLDDTPAPAANGEVAIRIIGAGEHEAEREGAGLVVGQVREVSSQSDVSLQPMTAMASDTQGDSVGDRALPLGEGVSQSSSSVGADAETGDGVGVNSRDSSYQRYDIQQAARWIEQVLPFSLLLLVVFIRQHLQGFFVTIWIAAVMFKSNDILRKQTALKGERKIYVLIGISLAFIVHVVGIYWWYRNDDLLYPLVMLPPKSIPPFWHAIFIIMVNGVFLCPSLVFTFSILW